MNTLEVIFKNAAEANTGLDMHYWSFAYFTGNIRKHFDFKGLTPGDLIQCSVCQYDFPLGKSKVIVEGKPATCYLWEEEKESCTFIAGAMVRKHVRRGVIVEDGDDEAVHDHANNCMINREYFL